MTEILALPTRPYAADSPLAYLLDLAAEAGVPSEEEQRDDAETTAAHHVYSAYPHSLAQVVEAMDWRGYPALRPDGYKDFEPSAVAWLDGGLWLHHTLHITEADGAQDVLTLIVPCTCGRGYADIRLDTEDDLLEILADLRPTHGRSPHTDTPLDCGSIHPAPQQDGRR
ncbi:hypothetical protein GCM10010377_68690 [Streptomyces viridiviolaceus]|uniref:Uncharacterized protein n=1 Tax=Streptomyces viridiviolaceus TaxID=68282 RepID=A0ABW2EAI3_9ACTN|nr:hypothetical protein [Streptomyces viridiviolaceus]GHB68036.1 hypothetical protein GCM10010377_68690 [Streptomyces viridiviolaceus]